MKVPVAVNCSVVPFSIVVEVAAVTAMDFKTASDTVSVTIPVTFWFAATANVAVMTLVPFVTAVTFPFEPADVRDRRDGRRRRRPGDARREVLRRLVRERARRA